MQQGREDFVQSLATGLSVLESFSEAHPKMTLSEVARQTGISRASARRMLLTLVQLGYAATDGRQFELTPRVLGLGYGFWSGYGLKELLQPSLQELAGRLGESCSASVLVGDQIMYVARAHTRRIMRMDLGVGTRLPAFATSMGRVLLSDRDSAELTEILSRAERPQLTPATVTDVAALVARIDAARSEGCAMVDQELEAGLRSVAVPVAHPERGILTAINTSVSAGFETAEETRERVLPGLQATARQVEQTVLSWERGTAQVPGV